MRIKIHHTANKCLHFKHMTILHHVSCVQKWLIWFHVVMLWLDSLRMVHCTLKQVAIFSVMLQNKYLMNKFVHTVGLVSWVSHVFLTPPLPSQLNSPFQSYWCSRILIKSQFTTWCLWRNANMVMLHPGMYCGNMCGNMACGHHRLHTWPEIKTTLVIKLCHFTTHC